MHEPQRGIDAFNAVGALRAYDSIRLQRPSGKRTAVHGSAHRPGVRLVAA
jgi:hypothetical protein